ncbi:MAG: SoxR reducing system RseC family protein [Gammaproteobacteria bacterium]|nr:SoxR reducing system RseC family protein [Gammaproteobacteria bacterium]
MIEETAKIVDLEGEYAWVETQRQSACSACAVNKGCGTATISKVLGQKRTRVRTINRLGAKSGDLVVIGIREQALVRGSIAVYAVPLLLLLAGGLFGDWLGQGTDGEGLSILFGLFGLGAGFAWLYYFSKKVSTSPSYQPEILRYHAPQYHV